MFNDSATLRYSSGDFSEIYEEYRAQANEHFPSQYIVQHVQPTHCIGKGEGVSSMDWVICLPLLECLSASN